MMAKIGEDDQHCNALNKLDEDEKKRNFVSGERACGREQMEGCGLRQRQGIEGIYDERHVFTDCRYKYC